MRIIPVTLAIARATSLIRQYPRSAVRFQLTHRLGIHRLSLILLAAPLTHGDIQNLWSPSQELSNDVSYVGLSEKFIISTCLRVWGLRWNNFTWGCRIMVRFKICDLQAKNFPMMYHMLVYLWNFYNLYMFKVWGLRWYKFIWGCRIMLIFRICDLQVKRFLKITLEITLKRTLECTLQCKNLCKLHWQCRFQFIIFSACVLSF